MVRERPEGYTRAELLELTGMSRTTLYSRLDGLTAAGLLYEGGQQTSTGGRPPTVLQFDARNRVVLGLDIGHHSMRVAVLDLAGNVLRLRRSMRRGTEQLDDDIDRLAEAGRSLLAEMPGVKLAGVGVAVPAPVETTSGIRWPSVTMPDRSYPTLDRLNERFDTLVCLENDARALALGAAASVDRLADDDVLLAVKYGTGLGAGIVTGTQIMRGTTGSAGDIGHMRISNEGPLCTCGNRGCLAAFSSGRAMLRELARPDLATVEDLARAFEEGDTEVVAEIAASARMLGRYVAALMHAVNPRHVCIGGVLGRVPEIRALLIDAVRANSHERVHSAADYPAVASGSVLRGLASLVVATAFNPDRIDAALAADQPL